MHPPRGRCFRRWKLRLREPPPGHFDRPEMRRTGGATPMSTASLSSLAKTARRGETQPVRKAFHPPKDMSLRPPFFRFVLALMGACFVVWGSKGDFLNIPGLGPIQLFDFKRDAAWAFIAAAVAIVPLTLLSRRAFAWLAWACAVGILSFILTSLWNKTQSTLASIEESNKEMVSMGFAPTKVDLSFSNVVRSGSVQVAGGLVIQFVGLCLKRRSTRTA